MAKKSLLGRIRDFFEGAVQATKNAFRGQQPDPDDIVSQPVAIPDPITQPIEPVFVEEEPIEPDEAEEETDPLEGLTPEEVEDLDIEDAPYALPGDFDPEKVRARRILTSYAEAQNYADEIPVPTDIFKNPRTRLYFVVVMYP